MILIHALLTGFWFGAIIAFFALIFKPSKQNLNTLAFAIVGIFVLSILSVL